jgi:hypothetical protein
MKLQNQYMKYNLIFSGIQEKVAANKNERSNQDP